MITDRLPVADMPLPIRRNDPNLAFQPLLQFRSTDGLTVAKVGDQVFSWHSIGRYPGWSLFETDLRSKLSLVQTRIRNVTLTRLGFRYVNALTRDEHRVTGVDDLDMSISVAGAPLKSALNLNYKIQEPKHSIVVKIATPEIIMLFPKPFAVLVDIDVSTDGATSIPQGDEVWPWIENAHDVLKSHFFGLLKPATVSALSGS